MVRRPRCRNVAVVAAVVVGALASAAPPRALAQAQGGRSCESVEQHQFDFWVGHWDVFVPSGKKAGESRIEVVADGCALLENWSGAAGVSGKSLNFYDRRDRRWHQEWVDGSGTELSLVGSFVDRSMVLASSAPDPADPAQTVLQRIAWTPAADGSVRQLWESSTDGGRTWTVLFDGHYVRVP